MMDFMRKHAIWFALVGGLIFALQALAVSLDGVDAPSETIAPTLESPHPSIPPSALTRAIRALQRIELEQLTLRQKMDDLLARRQMGTQISEQDVSEIEGILTKLDRMEAEQAETRAMLESIGASRRKARTMDRVESTSEEELMMGSLSQETGEGVMDDDSVAASDSQTAPEAAQHREEMRGGSMLTTAQLAAGSGLYEQGREAFTNLKFYAAVRSFRKFLQEYPTHPTAMEARHWLGEALYAEGKFDEAINAFAEVVRDESSPYQSRALLKTGFAWFDLGNYDQAEIVLLEVQDRKPGSQLARQAQLRLDRLYELRPKTDAE